VWAYAAVSGHGAVDRPPRPPPLPPLRPAPPALKKKNKKKQQQFLFITFVFGIAANKWRPGHRWTPRRRQWWWWTCGRGGSTTAS
jgi:hypothetical protein